MYIDYQTAVAYLGLDDQIMTADDVANALCAALCNEDGTLDKEKYEAFLDAVSVEVATIQIPEPAALCFDINSKPYVFVDETEYVEYSMPRWLYFEEKKVLLQKQKGILCKMPQVIHKPLRRYNRRR